MFGGGYYWGVSILIIGFFGIVKIILSGVFVEVVC